MKNELMVFEGNEIEVFELNNKVLFNAKHIGECLGVVNVNKNIADMENYEVVKLKNSDITNGDFRNLNNAGENFLTEAGVYSLIMVSRKPNAKAFKKWVVTEVLPSIRNNGGYIANQENMTTEQFLAQAILFSQKIIAEKEALLLEAKPKVEYYDKVLDSESELTTSQIAKECFMSAKQLNLILSHAKVQYKQNGQWLLYADYQNKGYTKTRTKAYLDSSGVQQTKHYTVWTEKGREFILDLVDDL